MNFHFDTNLYLNHIIPKIQELQLVAELEQVKQGDVQD